MLLIQIARLGTHTASVLVSACGWKDSEAYIKDASAIKNIRECYVCGIYGEELKDTTLEVESLAGLETTKVNVVNNIATSFYKEKMTAYVIDGKTYVECEDFIKKLG